MASESKLPGQLPDDASLSVDVRPLVYGALSDVMSRRSLADLVGMHDTICETIARLRAVGMPLCADEVDQVREAIEVRAAELRRCRG